MGKIRRIPLEALAPAVLGRATDKAIVLVPATFDESKPADVLVHFHGHNHGNIENPGGSVNDINVDKIESQIEGRTQTIGIIPQALDTNSTFGEKSAAPTQGPNKAFDTDAFVHEVLSVLVSIGKLTKVPTVNGIIISGHSGAGEQIDQMMLAGDKESPIPRNFKGLILIDAINGDHEFAGLRSYLITKLNDELAQIKSKTTVADKRAFLKTSFRFQGYYSATPPYPKYYDPSLKPNADKRCNPHDKPEDAKSVEDVFVRFFCQHETDLGGRGSDVYNDFRANYHVEFAPSRVHPTMVQDHLKRGLSVMPKPEDGGGSMPAFAPSAVHEVVRSAGHRLPDMDRRWAEGRFGQSLDGVRIHDDEAAGKSAQAMRAKAYTVGRDIVFARGRYVPGSPTGRKLLAHELAHVMQQGGPRRTGGALPAALPVGGPGDAFEREAERAEWRAGAVDAASSDLRLQRSPADDQACADLCEATHNAHPAPAGTCNYREPEHCPSYESWIHTFAALRTFSAADTPGTHRTNFGVIGAGPADRDFRPAPRPSGLAPNVPAPPQPAPPPSTPLKPGERFIDHPTDDWVRHCLPENLRATAYQLPADCADIAMILRHVWLAAHHRTEQMGRYTLGDAAGRANTRGTLNLISNVGTEQVANMVAPYADADGHPLRTFKALEPLLHPGDILVWWHYDYGFNRPRTGGHTHTIADVVRDDANHIVSLTLLQGNEPIFGRPDPHAPVDPVNNPARQKEDIHDFITAENAAARQQNPHARLHAQPADDALGHAPGRRIERTTSAMSGISLKDTPVTQGGKTRNLWQWGSETLLVVAGPGRGASRPASRVLRGGKTAPRQLTDWNNALAHSPASQLVGRFERMLGELRATVEGGKSAAEADVRAVGSAAGARVWALGRAAHDLGDVSHFELLKALEHMIEAYAENRPDHPGSNASSFYNSITASLRQHLRWLWDALNMAGRGADNINFLTGTPRGPTVNILVTGFDPFGPDAGPGLQDLPPSQPAGSFDPFARGTGPRPPTPGQWNPSGAAVLALDGQRLRVRDSHGHRGTAAVEGVVLPVSYAEFDGGIVERMLGPHMRESDAVLTVSMGLQKPDDPVRLEHYAVGVRHIMGQMRSVPGAPGASDLGPVVIPSNAPLAEIARDTERPAGPHGRPAAIAQPTIGETFAFEFPSPAAARSARSTLGGVLGGTPGTDVEMDSPAVLMIEQAAVVQGITATMTREGGGAEVQFKYGGQTFHATLREGPGGNFLSNEVSYRALRGIGKAQAPLSFHTHTQRAAPIRAEGDTAESRRLHRGDMSAARALRQTLIDTLTRIISSVARIVMDRRARGSGGRRP